MFAALVRQSLPWRQMHVFQVDERVAPHGHPDRNSTGLTHELLAHVTDLPADHVHLMPVETSDLERGCERYASVLRQVCGAPAVLDLVHLGLGDDGHTASLPPGDPVLLVKDRDVALSSTYRGRVRMTLTLPALERARAVLWLVGGADKVAALDGLLAGDTRLPAALVHNEQALLVTDRAAAVHLSATPSWPR